MKFQLVRLRHAMLLLALLSAPAVAVYPDFIFIAGADSWEVSAPPEWRSNLMAHNAARNQVVPAATTQILPLTWSTSLASTAQAYANQCTFAHSGAQGLGENIYGSTASSDPRLEAALRWATENVDYNYAANTCAGTQCVHYTQMVWAATTQLGCGTTNCSTGWPFGGGAWTFVVCNYTPQGNIIGQRPY